MFVLIGGVCLVSILCVLMWFTFAPEVSPIKTPLQRAIDLALHPDGRWESNCVPWEIYSVPDSDDEMWLRWSGPEGLTITLYLDQFPVYRFHGEEAQQILDAMGR